MKLKKLIWDSEFFNLNVAEINTANKFKNEVCKSFDIIYLKQNEDVEVLINGFQKTFQETKIIFTKPLIDKYTTFSDSIDFEEKPIENEKLYELAYVSGNYSRFLLDPKFGKENFKKLYCTWVDNSITKKFADKIFYTKKGDQITGFVTLQTNDNFGSIGLIAVDPSVQGKGIGSQLISDCESFCFLCGIKELRIPTQEGNLQACNFYKKIGYSEREKTVIKHYWKEI